MSTLAAAAKVNFASRLRARPVFALCGAGYRCAPLGGVYNWTISSPDISIEGAWRVVSTGSDRNWEKGRTDILVLRKERRGGTMFCPYSRAGNTSYNRRCGRQWRLWKNSQDCLTPSFSQFRSTSLGVDAVQRFHRYSRVLFLRTIITLL